jgi:4-amino-4-deoxy-L-arabinose transferase-like glycosyltransferase
LVHSASGDLAGANRPALARRLSRGVLQKYGMWAWCLAIVLAYVAFVDLGLNEPDEGRYAELGREMAVTGDWFTPHLNGIPHFQKPPLLYWLTALGVKAFGAHPWAARLPSILAALGTLALTAWIACMLVGRDWGCFAVSVLATCGGFYWLARMLTPDMLLTFWATLAIAFLVRRWQGGSEQWGLAFFVAMGLGFMTKGPMALVVPLGAALGLRWATPKAGRPKLPWLPGAIVTLALGLWWFVAQALVHHKLLKYFGGYELLQRFASRTHGRSKPIWFFVVVLPVAFLPWAFWLPALGKKAWQHVRQQLPWSPRAGLLAGWIGIPFVILSLSGSKLPTYILPLLPALALAVTIWWSEGQRSTTVARWMALPMLALLVVSAGMRDLADPLLKQQSDTRDLAELAMAQPDFAEATVFSARARAHGFTFMTGRLVSTTEDEADIVLKPTAEQRQRLFKDHVQLEQAMAKQPAAYGIARREDVPSIFPRERWRELGIEGDFVLLGKQPGGFK